MPLSSNRFRADVAAIALISGFLVSAVVLALAFIPHVDVIETSLSKQLALIVVGIVSGVLVVREERARNKILFLLFVLLGCQQILDVGYYFIVPSAVFRNSRFAGMMYFQFISTGLGLFVQIFCLLGAAALMNTILRTRTALMIGGGGALVAVVGILQPMVFNPKYLYTTPDITDFRIIDRAWIDMFQETKAPPKAEDLAERVALSRWDGNRRIGELSHEEEIERIINIEPYLFGYNYNMLVYKPLNDAWWRGNLMCALLIVLAILTWFIGDSPSVVYADRLTILLFAFSVFEVFHYYTYSTLKSYEVYLNYFNTGAFLSFMSVLAMTFILVKRLRFVQSYEGKYYESRLQALTPRVTRWRDGMDNAIIKAFFSGNPFRGRFLSKSARIGAEN